MRKLFVIMPIGIKSDMSGGPERSSTNFDTVYETLIKPAALASDFSVLRIDEVVTSGTVSDQFLQELFTADVVVADVSVPNPNVFYELGIRQAMGTGPTVLIASSPANLPFDIREQRVFFYDLTTLNKSLKALANLSKVLRATSETR